MPLAAPAEGLPALEDRLRLVQEVAHRRDVGASERRVARTPAGAAWQGPEPQRRDRGLPVRQDERSGRRAKRLRRWQEGPRPQEAPALVDTEGLVLGAKVHSAKVHDEDGIKLLLESARIELSRLKHLWVDAGYRGRAGGGPRRSSG